MNTKRELDMLLTVMARAMGAPMGPLWSRAGDGTLHATVGAILINRGSMANGRSWAVVEIITPTGAEQTLISARTGPALADAMRHWLDGWEAATRQTVETASAGLRRWLDDWEEATRQAAQPPSAE
jgi:hypothetical protein